MLTSFLPFNLELPLVVAEFLYRREQCLLDIHVLHLVLFHQAACPRLHLGLAIL